MSAATDRSRRSPTATPTGPGCACCVAGLGVSGFAAADALLERGAEVTVVDAARPADGSAMPERARILDILGADVRARPDAVADPARRRRRPRRHLTGLAPRPAAARRRRGGRHPGLGRGRARLAAAAARGRGAVARRHRHQRQDHHGADARLDPAGGRAAGAARRQRRHPGARGGHATPSPTTSSPSSCRASSCTGRTRIAPQRRRPAQRRPRPPRLARLARGVRRAKGKVYAQHRGRLRLQRRTTAPERLVEEAEVQEGCRADRLHPRHPRRRRSSASSTTCSSTGPSSSSAARPPPSSRTLDDLRGDAPSPAPHIVANALAAAALARAHGVPAGRRARRAARLRARAAPHRRGRHGRRRPLRRRLQGHQPARRRRVAGRLRARRLGRRRPAQGGRRRRARGGRRRPAARRGADRRATGPGSREALARHAPDVPVVDVDRTDTGAMDLVVERGRARSRTRATPCCSPPPARRWTCSPTTARAVTPSPRAVHRLAAGE